MTIKLSRMALIMPVIIMAILPLVAAWFAYPQTHLPPEFGVFPPVFVAEPPEFNLTIFILHLIFSHFVYLSVLYLTFNLYILR